MDPEDHIIKCESEWRRIEFKDERAWPHMFPNTLDDLPSKWFKLEEARGEMIDWKEIRQNFISDFQFQPSNENMKEAVKEIKEFIVE